MAPPRPAAAAAGAAKPAGAGAQPRQVLLFSGHIVDAPDRPQPRLPRSSLGEAARRIDSALARLDAGPADLALTQGAAGGDLLFAEAALARGMALQLLQPFDEPAFLQASVAPSGADWLQRYRAVVAQLDPLRPVRHAPQVLGLAAPGTDPYERCNLWLLDTAFALGGERVQLLALWDGRGGDGPGGTGHMVAQVRRRGGRATVIDPASLR